MYKITRLKNGPQVATLSVGGAHSVSIGVWIGTGSRYEPRHLSGISHFFEHMVFKGTKNRSYLEIKQSIEGRGGALNAFTSEEVTCFLAKVLSAHAHVAIDVLLDMLFNPLLRDEDLKKERLVIYEEIKMYVDLP
ncbi:MAG: insulinase family protein, partial [Candidatus Omnitrophica bacterium]|nr:insulinase family protein [Candidatus Omnitrophota bacterium]